MPTNPAETSAITTRLGECTIGHSPQIDMASAALPPMSSPINPPVTHSVTASIRN